MLTTLILLTHAQADEGWYAGGLDESCTAACESHGLTCTEQELFNHNHEVETSALVVDLIATLGGSTSAVICQEQYSTQADVPNFHPTECNRSSPDRELSTFNCDQRPVPENVGKQRLCYCHATPTPTPQPTTLTLDLPSNNWSRRYNKRLANGHMCSGDWQENTEGRPDEEVLTFDSLELEVLDEAAQTYRVVSEADPTTGLKFGSGSDCYSWSPCGASVYRGGFSVDVRGTGYELVSSYVVTTGWGQSLYVSQDGEAYSDSVLALDIADGTQLVEATCGGWCGQCEAEVVLRKIPVPTQSPTVSVPSSAPTLTPTAVPSQNPTSTPTATPTIPPTVAPTTSLPSAAPVADDTDNVQYVVKEETVHPYNSVFYLGIVVCICCLATCVGALLGHRSAANAVVRREVNMYEEKTAYRTTKKEAKRQPATSSPDVGAITPVLEEVWENGAAPTVDLEVVTPVEVDFAQEGPGGEEIQTPSDLESGLYHPQDHRPTRGELAPGAEGHQHTAPGSAPSHHRGYDLA